jgi:hypothetical protein
MTEQEYKNLKQINSSEKFRVLFYYCDGFSFVNFRDEQVDIHPSYIRHYSKVDVDEFIIVSTTEITIEQALRILNNKDMAQEIIKEIEKDIATQNKLLEVIETKMEHFLSLINDTEILPAAIENYRSSYGILEIEHNKILNNIQQLENIKQLKQVYDIS